MAALKEFTSKLQVSGGTRSVSELFKQSVEFVLGGQQLGFAVVDVVPDISHPLCSIGMMSYSPAVNTHGNPS
jgi:hypothetical protein